MKKRVARRARGAELLVVPSTCLCVANRPLRACSCACTKDCLLLLNPHTSRGGLSPHLHSRTQYTPRIEATSAPHISITSPVSRQLISSRPRASHHSLSTLFSLCLPFFFFSPFLSATCGRVTPAIHMTGERRCPSGHGRLARSCGVPLVPGRMNTAPPLVSLSPPPNTLSLPPKGQPHAPHPQAPHTRAGGVARHTRLVSAAPPFLSQATRALSPAPTHSRVRLDR